MRSYHEREPSTGPGKKAILKSAPTIFAILVVVMIGYQFLSLTSIRDVQKQTYENALLTFGKDVTDAPGSDLAKSFQSLGGTIHVGDAEESVLNLAEREVSGVDSITHEVAANSSRLNETYAGFRSMTLLFLAASALLVFDKLRPFILFALPLVAAVSSIAFGTQCITCTTSIEIDAFSAVALILFGTYVLLMTSTRLGKYSALWALGVVFMVVPILGAHSYLISAHPKLCYFCVASAVSAVAFGYEACRVIAAKRVVVLEASPGVTKATFAGLALLLVLHAGAGFGIWRPFSLPTDTIQTAFIGSNIGEYVNEELKQLPMVIVVTTQGCPSCKRLKSFLTDNPKIEFTEIPACSVLGARPCFKTDGSSFPVPLILGVDRNGAIVHETFGWPGVVESKAAFAEAWRNVVDN